MCPCECLICLAVDKVGEWDEIDISYKLFPFRYPGLSHFE